MLTAPLTASSTFYVNPTSNTVGIGYTDARKALEISSSSEQLRLTWQRKVGFIGADIHSDLYTTGTGHLILSSSAQRVGIGTDTPTRMLDVEGNMRVGGNLEITGTLSAKVTDFVVSANSITLGDGIGDTVIFNAATGTIMNGLNWDNDTFVMDSNQNRIGIGVEHPTARLHVSSSTQTLLKLNDATFTVSSAGDMTIDPSGNYLTASSGLNVSGSTFLGTLPTQHTVVSGELSASVAVSSSLGRFTELTSSGITDGIATITGGTLTTAGNVNANNLGGTLTTAAQAAITSVGTLSSLTVTGDLTIDTEVLKVNSATNRVGIGRVDPERKFEVFTTDPQMRLTYQKYQEFGPPRIFSDLYTDSGGLLVLSGSGGKTKINNNLQITGLVAGTATSTSYLALDASNNVILTSSIGTGTEIRSRRVITSHTTSSASDYYLGVSSSSNIEILLINASSLDNGQTYTFKDEKGNAGDIQLKILASGSQTIDGNSYIIIESPYGAVNLYTNGVDKYFIF